MRNNGEIGR